MIWTISSSAMGFIHDGGGLYRRRFAGRDARDGDAEARAPAEPRFEGQPAAELLGHEIEDDVKPEPGSAFVAAGGEKRVERAALGLRGPAHAVGGPADIHV